MFARRVCQVVSVLICLIGDCEEWPRTIPAKCGIVEIGDDDGGHSEIGWIGHASVDAEVPRRLVRVGCRDLLPEAVPAELCFVYPLRIRSPYPVGSQNLRIKVRAGEPLIMNDSDVLLGLQAVAVKISD